MNTPLPLTIQAFNKNNRIIEQVETRLTPGEKINPVTLDVPDVIRNDIARIAIKERPSAGTVILMDDQFRRKFIGIVDTEDEGKTPLIEKDYYLTKALEPYAKLTHGTVDELIAQQIDMIIMPDIGAMPPATLDMVEEWVDQGGLLLRFAGPNMTQNMGGADQYLLPVPIRRGGRALDGALTWEKPVRLTEIPEHSPLYGIDIQDDITIKRQLLAEPVSGLSDKSWALLEDGTPLITAARQGNGQIVFVHTTATPEWSNLALSGFYIQMLRRMTELAGHMGTENTARQGGVYQPLLTLNEKGTLTRPAPTNRPIEAGMIESLPVSSIHAPGLYHSAGRSIRFNLGQRIDNFVPMPAPPSSAITRGYENSAQENLLPQILLLAFALFLIDWVIMILMQSRLRFARLFSAAMIVILPAPSYAAQTYADGIYLAYVRTEQPQVNRTVEQGLNVLADTLIRRTSAEPSGIIAIDPNKDELTFFPLIYWPVTKNPPALTTQGLQNMQYYLDHGGTILFDTRDQIATPSGGAMRGMMQSPNASALQNLIGQLNIPPLTPMADDHIISRSFYLLTEFPGRYNNGIIWVEEESKSGRDGVSSVIIGGHDWAGAWAAANDIGSLSGGAQQQEMSLRFGVNLMMYALTGNYKADQVHIPHILERLGQ
jgi:hypothetical protein